MSKVDDLNSSIEKAQETLRQVDEGYTGVLFHPSSDQWFDDLKELIANNADFDSAQFNTGYDNHTTLMYAPDSGAIDPSVVSGLVGGHLLMQNPKFELFGEDPMNDGYLVMTYDSDLLSSYNNRLRSMGEVPSAISQDYKPHVTLAKNVKGLDMSTLPELPSSLNMVISNVKCGVVNSD